MSRSIETLLARFHQRDRRALAQLLTMAENGRAPAPPPSQAPSQTARPILLGVTGAGGAGKSTLVGALVARLRAAGQTVAVLACDPNSPLTGGALLGDRIRVPAAAADEGVYFRSLSTRGASGGVAAAVAEMLPWLVAFGFDVVIVETVGVGQDQFAVRQLVDTLLLVLTPNTGDEVQWAKAGLIEVADVVAVNKADLPGADRLVSQLVESLSLSPRTPPVVKVTANAGSGLEELWQAIVSHSPE